MSARSIKVLLVNLPEKKSFQKQHIMIKRARYYCNLLSGCFISSWYTVIDIWGRQHMGRRVFHLSSILTKFGVATVYYFWFFMLAVSMGHYKKGAFRGVNELAHFSQIWYVAGFSPQWKSTTVSNNSTWNSSFDLFLQPFNASTSSGGPGLNNQESCTIKEELAYGCSGVQAALEANGLGVS